MHKLSLRNESPHFRSCYAIALAVVTVAAPAAIAGSKHTAVEVNSPAPANTNVIILADAHPYRHCHNLPRRTYCHKQDRLPQNWPPHSDTPHPGESKRRLLPCESDDRDCKPRPQNGKG
jgi:hypothetical protein